MKARVIEKKLSDGSKVYTVALKRTGEPHEIYFEMDCELSANRLVAMFEEYRIQEVWID